MEAFLGILEIIGCILFVIFFLGFCIFIHELGHFLTARLCGMHVNAFSIGFKKAWGKKINGVDYRIGWLPFGGYVDIPQIDSTSIPHTAEGEELPPAKPIHRLISALAGPFFNILFGLALGCVVWGIGVPQRSPKMREIVVQSIEKIGPEYKAGLRKGDTIVKLNDKTFFWTWEKFITEGLLSVGKVKLTVKRDGKYLDVFYLPEQNPRAPARMRISEVAWPYFQAKIPLKMFPLKDSPAAKAGMKDGDIIVSVNNVRIENDYLFWGMINYCNGKMLNFEVDRKGELIKLAPIKPILHKTAMQGVKKVYKIGVVFELRKGLKVSSLIIGSPADIAGVRLNDIVEKINGKKLADFKAFKDIITPLKDTPFTMQIRRGKKLIDLKLAAASPQVYDIGVDLQILDYPSPWQQFINVIDMSYKSLRGMGILAMRKLGLTKKETSLKFKHLGGPIAITTTLYRSVKDGSIRFGLYFVVLVSFALAIFNLLPLPVLDGGHMTLALIEIIIRKPVHEGTVKVLTIIFIFLLITMMIFVTFNDITKEIKIYNYQNSKTTGKIEKVTPAKDIIEKKDVKETPVKTDKSR